MAEIGKTGILKSGKSEAAAKLKRVSSRVALAVSGQRKQSAKTQLEELRNENRILKDSLERETKVKEELCKTLQCLADKVLEYVDQTELQQYEGYKCDNQCDTTDILSPLNFTDLHAGQNTSSSSRFIHMLTFLLEDKFGEDSEHMVNRLEELETRVTEQAQELANQTCLRMKLQNGLNDIDVSRSLNEVRSIVDTLRIETDNDPKHSTTKSTTFDVTDSSSMSITPPPDEITPGKKLPGDTHIRRLHPSVKEDIITQLSYSKVNGADWQMFAQRVGIADSTVERLKSLHVPRPMLDVLETWGKSPGATIRMLHRHLISPQIRCRMLAKKLADLYQVD